MNGIKRKFYDHILEGSEATISNAKDCATGLDWTSIDKKNGYFMHMQHHCTINGIGIWYNYAVDCIYFSDEINVIYEN